MKRTHVFLPDPLIKRLKKAADVSGLSVAEIIRRAVTDYFAKHDKEYR
jgi:Ribbon-helix-helix protein, copG family